MTEPVHGEPVIDSKIVKEISQGAHEPVIDSEEEKGNFRDLTEKRAYRFDGSGGFIQSRWNFEQSEPYKFRWFHIELPKKDVRLGGIPLMLMNVLCPPLKLEEIFSLAVDGSFCGHDKDALIFRVNSPGACSGEFTFRIAARVAETMVITVSLGKVPRLDMSPMLFKGHSMLQLTPRANEWNNLAKIRELEYLMRSYHSVEAINNVPKSASNLVVHVIDAHMHHLQHCIAKLEMELDLLELQLDKGDVYLKKEMLDDKRFPKMGRNLQRLLQATALAEQVFPQVKEKCSSKPWFVDTDIRALEGVIDCLTRLKEHVGFLINRVVAIQDGLDRTQAEQINRRLYYLSIFSGVFLPLSIITGVFGMNVGGIPWTKQSNRNGFRNVIILSGVMLLFVLLCFILPTIYSRLSRARARRSVLHLAQHNGHG